jgi:esterase/lipase
MNIVIIPGFMGHPDEVTFKDLSVGLETKGHTVIKVAWPHLPDDMTKYCFSETIAHARTVISSLKNDNLVLLGFSMGGIIASLLATELKPQKLGLIVSPYQAGSEDDLAGKYKEWQEVGYRDLTSSKYGELRVPFSFIEDAQKYNALDYIEKIHLPLLFVVGENDDKVSMAASRKVFEKANEPKQWHQIPGMEHKYQYQPEMLAEVNRIITDFVGH